MNSNLAPRQPSRLAVFWGWNFKRASRICSLRATDFVKTQRGREVPIASPNTITKLRKGFKGEPVEPEIAFDLIHFFTDNEERTRRLQEHRVPTDAIIVPGNSRLKEEAIPLLDLANWRQFDHPLIDGYVREMLRNGGFLAEPHMRHIAKFLFEYAGRTAQGHFGEFEEPSDLYETTEEYEVCYPQAYRALGPKRGGR